MIDKIMKEKTITWWQGAIIIALSIACAGCLTLFIGEDIASLNIFTPTNKKGDFHITDIYNAVEKNNIDDVGGRPLSEEVVVVGIDGLGRAETLEVIRKVASLQPAAIGLDFGMKDSVMLRDEVMEVIVSNPLIVSPMELVPVGEETFRDSLLSFYEERYPVHRGFVNIDAAEMWNVIRTFHPMVLTADGDTLPNMVLEMARVAKPERAQALLDRHQAVEHIDFVSREIMVIPPHCLGMEEVENYMRGKAVLIGDTAYLPDMRITPLHEPMGGVLVHAYALQTILGNSYIQAWPEWLIWLIAFGLAGAFVLILQGARHLSNSGNWLIRMSQFVLMFLLVWCGCYIFSVYHTYADFTNVIAMLGFSALSFDIFYALIGLWKLLFKIKN